MKKFPVPETMSVSWCWPPYTQPDAKWYMMRFADSKALDELYRKETGAKDTPTHEQKLALMQKHGWLTKIYGNFTHVARPD